MVRLGAHVASLKRACYRVVVYVWTRDRRLLCVSRPWAEMSLSPLKVLHLSLQPPHWTTAEIATHCVVCALTRVRGVAVWAVGPPEGEARVPRPASPFGFSTFVPVVRVLLLRFAFSFGGTIPHTALGGRRLFLRPDFVQP